MLKIKKFHIILLSFFLISLSLFFLYLASSLSLKKIDNRSYGEAENVRNGFAQVSKIMEKLASKEYVTCEENLQSCIFKNNKELIIIPKGNYLIEKPLKIPNSSKIFIREDAVIKLSNSAKMPRFGGSVIELKGNYKDLISDITIIQNGIIDGNKIIHSYDKSGNEGIKIDYADRVVIFGNGVIQNVSGDGIDLDATSNSVILGVSTINNSGSGIHFGSPRPIIKSSKNNQIIGAYSSENGFYHKRNGFDVSFPNMNSATYAWSIADKNFKNWEILGSNSEVFKGVSINSKTKDDTQGASIVEINDSFQKNYLTNLPYIKTLIKRDIYSYLFDKKISEDFTELKYLRNKLENE